MVTARSQAPSVMTFMNKHLSALMRAVGALGWVIATSVHAQHTVLMTSNLPYASESQVRETLARPPHAKTVPSEGKPLTVLTGFLTRADGTALSQRGRDPTNVLDRSGKPIVDPAADPSAADTINTSAIVFLSSLKCIDPLP